MSSFMTKWSVLQEHDVVPGDLDAEGFVTDRAITAWVESACSAYLGQSDRLHSARHDTDLPRGTRVERPEQVVVSATATEVHPSSFTIAVRLRPIGATADEALNAMCVVTLEDPSGQVQPVDDGVRDELIALEHAARHYN